MSATFYDLLKFAKTGNAAPEMTQYDKMKALSMCKAGFPVKTLTGVPPIPFDSDGTPLIAWTVVGNEVQDGTPSPQNIVIPQECGDLVESGEHAGEYAVSISCGGTTYPVYLQEPIRKIGDSADIASAVGTSGPATRKIRKKVFDGTEAFDKDPSRNVFYLLNFGDDAVRTAGVITSVCSHYLAIGNVSGAVNMPDNCFAFRSSSKRLYIRDDTITTDADAFKFYLAEQYANDTPVTIWYVLAEPQTETFDAPTITPQKGSNTLTVNTTLPPSEVSITGGIREGV